MIKGQTDRQVLIDWMPLQAFSHFHHELTVLICLRMTKVKEKPAPNCCLCVCVCVCIFVWVLFSLSIRKEWKTCSRWKKTEVIFHDHVLAMNKINKQKGEGRRTEVMLEQKIDKMKIKEVLVSNSSSCFTMVCWNLQSFTTVPSLCKKCWPILKLISFYTHSLLFIHC